MTDVVVLDPGSAVPPSEQTRAQLADAIRTGALAAGSRLPTVRALADRLGLAANTVARAYRELEADGLVETRGRGGTVVAWSADEAERRLQQAATAFAEQVRSIGAGRDAALRAVERALRSGAAEAAD